MFLLLFRVGLLALALVQWTILLFLALLALPVWLRVAGVAEAVGLLLVALPIWLRVAGVAAAVGLLLIALQCGLSVVGVVQSALVVFLFLIFID